MADPSCECHDVAMIFKTHDKRWICRIENREKGRRWRAANPEKAKAIHQRQVDGLDPCSRPNCDRRGFNRDRYGVTLCQSHWLRTPGHVFAHIPMDAPIKTHAASSALCIDCGVVLGRQWKEQRRGNRCGTCRYRFYRTKRSTDESL